MTPEQHQQVGELFLAVKDLPLAEREAALDQMCNGDDALRREVESLLQFQTQAEDFIETRALDVVARQIAADHLVFQPGMQVAHYRIVSPLGSGGMGEVFLAEDTQLNRQVALKIVPSAYTHDPERLKRFQTEARATAALNHPNIATVHAVEEQNGQYFIAMEYVAGQLLSQVIPAEGFELERFFELAIPLADAFAHAHEKGVIHRDIKPGNIVVTEAGQPKILDFGLARISYQGTTVPSEPSLTPEGFVMGTPGYMSPEQAKGERADHRSDIFSFGVVMYQLLTGRHPFRGGSFATFVSELLKEEPPPVSNFRPQLPSMLSRVVSQCLNKDHRRRYQTMLEVRTLLEGIRAECSEKAVTKTWVSPSTNPATGVRFGLVGLGLALMVMTGIALWSLFRPAPDSLNPVTRFALTPRAGQQGVYSEVQLSPDGSAIVFDDTRNGQSQIFVRYFNQFDAQPVTGTEGGKRPFFSPDGQWIAFFQGEQKLLKVPVTGGIPLTLCDTCPVAFEMNWPTESHIFVSDASGLYRVSTQGGTPERLTTIDQSKGEKNHRAPYLLPDQKHLLFTVDAKEGKQCAVLSLETRAWQLIADLPDAGFARYLPSGHLVFHRSHQLLAVPFDPVQLKVTGTPVTILDGVFPNSDFKIAANGTLAYLPNPSNKDNLLVWVNRQGEKTPVFDQRANFRSPRLSPDGKRIAVQVEQDIWVYQLDSGRGIRLTFGGDNQVPLWSPDGKSIVFATNRNGVWSINRVAADQSGGGAIERLISGETRYIPYSWHPDGTTLALTVISSTNNTDIVVYTPADGKISTVMSLPFIEDTPRFSPDGRWLAYFSMETGKVEVYAQPYPGSAGKTPISQGGGMFPVWSPDGKELFFRNGPRIYAVPIKTLGSTLVAGNSHVLFEGKYLTNFDVSPDGQRFLMVQNESGSMPGQIHIVLNWTTELNTQLNRGPIK